MLCIMLYDCFYFNEEKKSLLGKLQASSILSETTQKTRAAILSYSIKLANDTDINIRFTAAV